MYGGVFVIKEIMEEINKAEQQAEKALQDAGYKAAFMVDSTKKEVEKNRETALKNQKKEAEKRMENVQTEGRKFEEKIQNETVKERQKIVNRAKEKEEGAIALILSNIVG